MRLDFLLRSRLFLRAIALIVAGIIWFYVANDVQTETERTFRVPVVYRNVPAGFRYTTDTETVSLEVAGQRNLYPGLREDSVTCEVDLAGLRPGRYRLPIRPVLPSGARLIKVSPGYASVSLVHVVERLVPVRLEIAEGLPQGAFLESVRIKPSEVTVVGPEELVGGIEYLPVRASLEEIGKGVELDLPVERGDIPTGPEGVSMQPVRVKVNASLAMGNPKKRVSLEATLTGKVGRDYEMEAVVVEPAEITVQGPSEALRDLDKMVTDPIDLSTLTGSQNLMVPLALPPAGIEVLGDPNVKVQIVLTKKRLTRRYSMIPVQIEGKSIYPAWRVEPQEVDVVVEGAPSLLDSLNHQGKVFEAFVDVTHIISKKLTVPVQTRTELEGLRIIKTEPAEVTVFAIIQ